MPRKKKEEQVEESEVTKVTSRKRRTDVWFIMKALFITGRMKIPFLM